MDLTPLLVFIDQHRPLIGVFGFDAHLTHNAICFAIDGGEDYVFELPVALVQALDAAYQNQYSNSSHLPEQRIDFEHLVAIYGIGAAENILLTASRLRKLNLLLED